MYNSDDFALMIKDWQADNSPEYDDLVIDAPEFDNGEWVSYAHDDKVAYTLTDDGTGNIIINYSGTRPFNNWGGKRPNSGRPSTGRKKHVVYITEEEYLKVKQLIEELRKPSE
jgi:hypothetical protein